MNVPLDGFPDLPFYNYYYVGGPLDGQISSGFRPYFRLVVEGNIYEVNAFVDTTNPDDYVEWVNDGTRKITLYFKGVDENWDGNSSPISLPRKIRNPEKVCEFYDPHPGFAGCSIRIPEPVRLIANEISGSRMSLRQAVFLISAATEGVVEVVEGTPLKWSRLGVGIEGEGMITLKMEGADGCIHSWRVIRFKE